MSALATAILLGAQKTPAEEGRDVVLVMLAVGSLVQWRRWELPAPSLTPNAVYHVIEMAALVLLYVAARGLTSTSARC